MPSFLDSTVLHRPRWRRGGILLAILAVAVIAAWLMLQQPDEEEAAAVRQKVLATCAAIEMDLRAALGDSLQQGRPACGVDISGQQFVQIPVGVFGLRELAVLQANDNFIAALPAEIGNAHSLRLLELRDNKLQSLPRELGGLQELEVLDVRGNPLPASEVATIRALLPDSVVLH